MSRLTDEQLRNLEMWASMDLHDRECDLVQSAVAELKERRAADLTAEEREALGFAAKVVGKGQSILIMTGVEHGDYDRALAVLDKLLAATEQTP